MSQARFVLAVILIIRGSMRFRFAGWGFDIVAADAVVQSVERKLFVWKVKRLGFQPSKTDDL